MMRLSYLAASIAAGCNLSAGTVSAQNYPHKAIRFIMPYPAGNTPAQFASYIKLELVKWGKVIKEAGIRVD